MCTRRYRANSICFAWELIILEMRFLTILIGALVMDPIVAAWLVITITVALLCVQAKLKPFRESREEAEHWSSCNKMSVVCYSSQLVVLVVGLVNIILYGSWSSTIRLLLSLVAVVALVVPLVLTGMIIAMNKDTYARVATDAMNNIMYEAESIDRDEGYLDDTTSVEGDAQPV